ncbi:DNA-binding protein [Pseudoxanthomonas sp. LjRoot168]|uniref:DNA-binding protein n=1 Tax=unclassified Pseudoxanthomonas TaxID=2645906 RepID=UPI003ECE27E4
MPAVHSRQIATEENVAQACDELFRKGESITGSAVHAMIEGGSMSVIYRFIETWQQKHRQRFLMMEAALDLDSPSVRALEAIWEAAVRTRPQQQAQAKRATKAKPKSKAKPAKKVKP